MTYRVTKILTLAEGADETEMMRDLAATAGNRREVVHSAIGRTLSETNDAATYIWRLHFANEASAHTWALHGGSHADAILNDRLRIRQVDSVGYVGGRAGSKQTLGRGIYRMLLISLKTSAGSADVAQFEHETHEMGHYIPSIVQWRISRVRESSGTSPWTHVWEQEYRDMEGLVRTYMLHPHHWGWINRWYDPECVEHIVGAVSQSFCSFEGSMF